VERTATRKQFWHGTATKHLRSILNRGLQPGKKKVFDEEDEDRGGGRSIKTYGGIYLTDNWMTAYSASGTAARKSVGIQSGPVETQLMVGVSYETRSPKVLADEDDVIGLAERVVGYAAYEMWQTGFGALFSQEDRAPWGVPGNFNPARYKEIAKAIKTGNISKSVEEFMTLAVRRWPRIGGRYQRQKQRIDVAAEALLRAFAAHLMEAEIKKYTEEGAPKPPALFRNTWKRLRDATDQFSQHVPEMSDPQESSMRHNIRVMQPIEYQGKNKINMVVEIQDALGGSKGTTLVFHYGAPHWPSFVAQYRSHIGGAFQVVDKSGRRLHYELGRFVTEWPEHWGPKPPDFREVAASRVAMRYLSQR